GEVLRLDPRWSEARVALSCCLRRMARGEEARAILREGLALTPRDVVLQAELARLAWLEGEQEEAFRILLETVRDDALSRDHLFGQLLTWASALDRRDEVV